MNLMSILIYLKIDRMIDRLNNDRKNITLTSSFYLIFTKKKQTRSYIIKKMSRAMLN